MLTVSGSAGGFTAPKIEMCPQLLNSVQEKYSIPCLESFLLLIIIENAACFETNSILCRLECRLFLLVYYASSVLVYRKAVYFKKYSFEYCVYYTSKASQCSHARLRGKKTFLPLRSDPRPRQLPHRSPSAGSAGPAADAASGGDTERRGVPSPTDPLHPVPGGLLGLDWVLLDICRDPQGSSPVHPAALSPSALRS